MKKTPRPLNYLNPPTDKHPYPTTFYPNVMHKLKAKAIEIGLGSKIENLKLHIPLLLLKRTIRGKVVFKNGTPVSNSEIRLIDISARNKCENKDCRSVINSNGTFSIDAYEGRKYYLEAKTVVKKKNKTKFFIGKSEPFILRANTSNIEIKLKKYLSYY